MAGTIPTIVYYGIALLQPSIFYLSALVICAIVGLSIGSSWTTAATLGVALVALAPALGASTVITAGAVISGAYFGDKMTPISETTVLVPSMVGGVTTQQHIGAMIWTSVPSMLIAAVGFTILGLLGVGEAPPFDRTAAQATLAGEFNISLLNLLPMVLLIILSLRRAPPFLSIMASAVLAGVMAWFTQPQVITAFVGEPASLATNVKALYSAMANGFVSNTGIPAIDDLFSRGGMESMLTTIWLVLGALSFAAIAESAGFLDRLIEPIVARAKSAGALLAAVIFTAIGLNIVTGDQYVSDRHAQPCLPGRLPPARHRAADAVADGRGRGHRHLAARPVEQLWRLHGRRAGRANGGLLPVRVLQPAQPAHLADLRADRLPHRAHRYAGRQRAMPRRGGHRRRPSHGRTETEGGPA